MYDSIHYTIGNFTVSTTLESKFTKIRLAKVTVITLPFYYDWKLHKICNTRTRFEGLDDFAVRFNCKIGDLHRSVL